MNYVWGRLTANWYLDIEQAVPPSDIDDAMRKSSIPSYGYFFLLVMSGSIATFGLLSNSAPAIIGAMIIAPLMAPIMSLAHGLVIARYARIVRSFLTLLLGILVVVGLSFFVTELVGIGIAGSEILSRTQPSLLDLGVAIVISAGVVMICQGYGSLKRGIIGLGVMTGLMLLLLSPLGESLDRIYFKSQVKKMAGELVREHSDLRPSRGWIESMQVRYIGDVLYVFIRSVIPRDDINSAKTMLARLQRKLSSELGMIERHYHLFSDTVSGGKASAILYSLIETAKTNQLEPYAYLKQVFTELPTASCVEDIEVLLPVRSVSELDEVA